MGKLLVFLTVMGFGTAMANEVVVCKLTKYPEVSGRIIKNRMQGDGASTPDFFFDGFVYFKKSYEVTTLGGENLETGECGRTSRPFTRDDKSYFRIFKPAYVRYFRNGTSKPIPYELDALLRNQVQSFLGSFNRRDRSFNYLRKL